MNDFKMLDAFKVHLVLGFVLHALSFLKGTKFICWILTYLFGQYVDHQ
jgi:hypothetical protein